MLVHRRVTGPPVLNSPTPINLYTWVKRRTARVKCLAQEPNTMSLARTGKEGGDVGGGGGEGGLQILLVDSCYGTRLEHKLNLT